MLALASTIFTAGQQRGEAPSSHPADGEVLTEFETEVSNCQHLQEGERLDLQRNHQKITFNTWNG